VGTKCQPSTTTRSHAVGPDFALHDRAAQRGIAGAPVRRIHPHQRACVVDAAFAQQDFHAGAATPASGPPGARLPQRHGAEGRERGVHRRHRRVDTLWRAHSPGVSPTRSIATDSRADRTARRNCATACASGAQAIHGPGLAICGSNADAVSATSKWRAPTATKRGSSSTGARGRPHRIEDELEHGMLLARRADQCGRIGRQVTQQHPARDPACEPREQRVVRMHGMQVRARDADARQFALPRFGQQRGQGEQRIAAQDAMRRIRTLACGGFFVRNRFVPPRTFAISTACRRRKTLRFATALHEQAGKVVEECGVHRHVLP
jgi:hypothetical protein